MEMKEILSGLNIGLWIIRNNLKTGENELYADEIMRKLLGVDNSVMPNDCYSHWEKNINPEYLPTVDMMVSEMANSGDVVQVEYLWNHPQEGEVLVRCSGRCTEKTDETIVYEGFHRVISNMEKSF
jgi:hypothetical protein